MTRYFARKTVCRHGHSHASAAEAARCLVLHQLAAEGQIDALVIEPQYWFQINGAVVTHTNGRRVGYKPDFGYLERGKVVVEDVKPANKGYGEARDVPVRQAIFRHLFPHIELRIVR